MTANVKARLEGTDKWMSYGDVTHAEAAASHAATFPFHAGRRIVTKLEGRKAEFLHDVKKVIKYEVNSLRQD